MDRDEQNGFDAPRLKKPFLFTVFQRAGDANTGGMVRYGAQYGLVAGKRIFLRGGLIFHTGYILRAPFRRSFRLRLCGPLCGLVDGQVNPV